MHENRPNFSAHSSIASFSCFLCDTAKQSVPLSAAIHDRIPQRRRTSQRLLTIVCACRVRGARSATHCAPWTTSTSTGGPFATWENTSWCANARARAAPLRGYACARTRSRIFLRLPLCDRARVGIIRAAAPPVPAPAPQQARASPARGQHPRAGDRSRRPRRGIHRDG